jgi:hypothetical protein
MLVLAQTTGPDASTVFYLSLLFIFVTAIVTAVLTKWARDKCLKLFHGYHVTVERNRGQTTWGKLKVFSSGIEITYDQPYIDTRGQRKTSYMVYGQEVEQNVLSILRYHDELEEEAQKARKKQVHRTFNPGPLKRLWRGIRNFVNTLRDAFSAAIGAAVGQFQKMNPAAALATQGQNVTQIGSALLARFANAYEPLLEQYIGQPVILDVADPINPNHATQQYAGYLADYTQGFVAIFNVNHTTAEDVCITLPDVERGDPLPPLPAPPAAGAPPIALPPPVKVEHCIAVRIDGARFRLHNTGHEPIVVRRLEREGFEPYLFGMTIPPNGTLDLPARDAKGGKLFIEIIRCLDVIAPRRFATIRHAGELVERRGLMDELALDQYLVSPRLLQTDKKQEKAEDGQWAAGD